MTISVDDLVRREVLLCASHLVFTLAQDTACSPQSTLGELCTQAQELRYPVGDFEEAARQAGWKPKGNTFVNSAGEISGLNTWEALCRAERLDPYEWEVFEHWFVSKWLAEKLEAKGERVDMDFAGHCVWGRTATGQGIACDSVIQEIHRDLIAS